MNIVKSLTVVTLLTSALMPNVPDPAQPITILFLVAAAALLLVWLARVAHGSCVIPRAACAAWLAVFLYIVCASAFVAVLWDTPIASWFRGAVPFLFLALFFPFSSLGRSTPVFLLNVLHAAAIVWLGKVLVTSAIAIPELLRGDLQRLTHGTEDWGSLTLPFSIAGLALSLFNPAQWAVRIRWIFAPLFFAMPFLTGYRSQILIGLALWMMFIATRPPRQRLHAVGTAFLAMGAILALLVFTQVGVAVMQRFEAIADEASGSRRAELNYALQQFAESPLLGKGLGHQVPAEVTFLGDWDVIAQAGVDTVGYIHNLPAYLLMDLGLLGFVAFCGFVISALARGAQQSSAHSRSLVIACCAVVLAVLAFCLVQATFRLIQTNLILAATAAVMVALPRQARRRFAACAEQPLRAEACR